MDQYTVVVILFCALINGALLVGVGRVFGHPPTPVRWSIGTLLIGLYAGVCFGADVSWVNQTICRILILTLAGWLSLGPRIKSIAIYVLLSLGVEEIALVLDSSKGLMVVLLLVLILHLTMHMFSGAASGRFVPVQLQFAGKNMKITALRDSGNMLRDPITGTPVLILGLRASQELTGLNKQQLQRPVEVMRHPPIPGLHLIPYKTISEGNGFILGVRMSAVRVGNWRGCLVVAFAPEEFGDKGEFDALTGGMV